MIGLCEMSSPSKKKYEASPRKFMNELSPRRVPRSPISFPKTPPQWKRPDEVMKLHRMKRRSLADRMNRIEHSSSETSFKCPEKNFGKRKNPFKLCSISVQDSPKKVKPDEDQDSKTLFRLLGLADPQSNHSDLLNFDDIIEKIRIQSEPKIKEQQQSRTQLPVDWALRFKLRFMSPHPFPWNKTLKTSEEALGITGFVRCVQESDANHNAMFHHCCLYWQYPSFPWLTVFPRRFQNKRPSDQTKQLPSFASNPQIKEALHSEFTQSFRSVFQLLRVRHCPYFYLISNLFSCLFRAAGINGTTEISAMIYPTGQGFRQLLRDNDIGFTTPLRDKTKRRSLDKNNSSENSEEHKENEDSDEEDEEHMTNQWLQSLGVDQPEIKMLSTSVDVEAGSQPEVDGTNESLVYVEGCDVSGLFNMLLNFRSMLSTTGPLAGVPPTLLAPVSFTKASLSSLEVRESTVKVEKDHFYSVEIKGPILPDTIHKLCDIVGGSLDKYSVTFATDECSKSFTAAVIAECKERSLCENENKKEKPGAAFSIQNLSDSGMNSSTLSKFCSDDVESFDCLKFSERLFSLV